MSYNETPVYIGPTIKEPLNLSEEELEKYRKIYPPGYTSKDYKHDWMKAFIINERDNKELWANEKL